MSELVKKDDLGLNRGNCQDETDFATTDRILATVILACFFFIGTLSNFSFISIYLYKQRRRNFCIGRNRSIRSTFKHQVNNKAIFTLSISNLLLSTIFIPYTIIFRVWNFDASEILLKIIEHLKDCLLYMNLLIIIILSIERYVAVCKPQYYKKLESNINKIMWIVFLIGFVLSATNYFIDVKLDLTCSANIFSLNKAINLNLLTSFILFSTSGIISTFFYVQIAWHHIRRGHQLKKDEKKKQDDELKMKEMKIEKKLMGNCCSSDEVKDVKLSNCQYQLSISEKQTSRSGGESGENESDMSKNKSDASVQTDMMLNKLFKKNSNIFSTNLITKISICVSWKL